MTPERYTITVRTEPGPWRTPAIVRLRHFLKAALRAYGLRCVGIKPEKKEL